MNKNQKKLWIYGVLIELNGKVVAKAPGQTVAETQEEAIKYAVNETAGKLKGLLSKDDVIFCVDMTEQAESAGFTSKNYYAKFDDQIRPQFKNYKGTITNDVGGGSRELLLEFDSKLTKEEISYDLIRQMEDISKVDLIKPNKVYTMRTYMDNLIVHDYNSDKALIAGCTGSGKETGTLTTILFHHDRLHNDKTLDETHLHVAVATIPSTVMELIKELSEVEGMVDPRDFTYYDYDRFKVYMVEEFRKKQYTNLTDKEKLWFNKNVNVVKSVKDIPPTHHQDIVPILLGGFHCLGLRDDTGAKLKKGYVGLDERMGIFAIGEAHKFLVNPSNKMWNNIDELNREFTIIITGTPYDYIFNEDHHLYFEPNETALFTWDDLCREKRQDPNGPYGKYPDVNYYGLPNLKEHLIVMKQDGMWKGDVNGWTWKKLLTTFDVHGNFVYKEAIVWIFRRLLNPSIGFNSKPDGLNIYSATDLCDVAKRHIIIRLPEGQNGRGVSDYIPKLAQLLKDENVIPERKILEVYKDGNIGNIKGVIKEDLTPTLTLTCTKYLTGTDIPSWGSVVFLAPIGNSIKLFEQIVGRVKRVHDGKTNCGIFVGNIDEVIQLHVQVQEWQSLEENETFNEVITKVLDNYNVFNGKNDFWSRLDFPDLASRLQSLHRNGQYGVGHCIKNLKVPDKFDYVFESNNGETEEVVIIDNGLTDAKDSERTIITDETKEMFEDLKDKSEFEKNKYYRNMVKVHLSRLRILCFLQNLNTLQDGVSLIKSEIENNFDNSWILDSIGVGFELLPKYIMDKSQIDIPYFNRWLTKINSKNLTVRDLLVLLSDKQLINKDTKFIPTKLSICDEMVLPHIGKSSILDPFGGRGSFLISWIELNKERGIKIDPSKIFYNDIDPFMVKVFKKINKEYDLGIPDKNILNEDGLDPSSKLNDIKSEVDLVIGNPPCQNSKHKAKKDSDWKKSLSIYDDVKCLSFIVPESFNSPTTLFEEKKNRLSHVNRTIKKHFKGVALCYITLNKKNQNKCKITTDDGEVDLDLNNHDCIPSQINYEIINLSKEVFTNSKEFKRGEHHSQKKINFVKKGKYDVIHSTKTLNTNIYHENHDKIRVHISATNSTKFDICVNKGLSQNHYWTEFKTLEDAEEYCDYLNSPNVQKILNLYRYSNLNYLRVISKL